MIVPQEFSLQVIFSGIYFCFALFEKKKVIVFSDNSMGLKVMDSSIDFILLSYRRWTWSWPSFSTWVSIDSWPAHFTWQIHQRSNNPPCGLPDKRSTGAVSATSPKTWRGTKDEQQDQLSSSTHHLRNSLIEALKRGMLSMHLCEITCNNTVTTMLLMPTTANDEAMWAEGISSSSSSSTSFYENILHYNKNSLCAF